MQKIVEHIGNTALTLLVAYFAFASNMAGTDNSKIDSLFARVNALEVRNSELEIRNSELQAEKVVANHRVINLLSQIKEDFDYPRAMEQMLDGFPEPTWIKEVSYEDGEIVFRMLVLNRAYEDTYRVSRLLYKGSTDFDVWTHKEAKEFYKHDITVYENKMPMSFVEEFREKRDAPPGSGVRPRLVHKFPIQLPGGRIGIGGMVIESLPVPADYVAMSVACDFMNRREKPKPTPTERDWLEQLAFYKMKAREPDL